MPTGPHHLALQVVDLSRVERFYVDVLGLAVLRRWPAADGGERAVWLDTGNGAFLALEVVPSHADHDASEEGRPGYYLFALAIAASERTRWQDRFAAAGVSVYKSTPFTLYVRDPEGNRVGLSHWPEPAADAL